MKPPGRRTSPFRLVIYTSMSAIAVVGLVYILRRTTTALPPTTRATSNTNVLYPADEQRDLFNQLYVLGDRFDGRAGNTAVEAVYYFPSLVSSLIAYAGRSPIQAQTLLAIQHNSDPTLIPFLINLERNEALEQNLPFKDILELQAGGSAPYPFVRFDPVVAPVDSDRIVLGVAWFRKPSGSPGAVTLQLTFRNIPGNVKPTVFTWDTSVLRLTESP
ncbi:MAG: hypothetical protein HY420_03660 [Candidatus Kerfeldbacteria bacterium]|nr:hypothetical protein [Candidatus Kerfeldbacteria bacterium]